VHFEVEVAHDRAVELVAASIKRERSKPTQQRSSAEQVSSDEAGPGVGSQPVAGGQVVSSWGSHDGGGQVRAVRKVRIEGGRPQPISPATQQFGTPERSDVPRRGDGRPRGADAAAFRGWTPLDGLSPEGDHQPPSLHDYPESTVREVRRSRTTASQGEHAGHADLDVAWAAAANEQPLPPLYSHGFEVTDQSTYTPPQSAQAATASPASTFPGAGSPTGSDAVRPVAEVIEQVAAVPVRPLAEAPAQRSASQPPGPAGETPAARTAQHAFVAPRIPVARNTAAGSTWQPTPASDLSSPQSTDVVRQPRLIEEADVATVRASTEAAPVRASTDGAALASQAVREGPTQRAFAHVNPPPTAPVPAKSPVARAIDDAEFGGEYLPSGRSLEAALQQSGPGQVGRDGRPVSLPTPFQGAQSPRGDRVAAAPPEPARSEPVREHVQSEPVRLEDDLRKVEAYLDRPNTPAIVRSEVVAAELGIDDQRSERALERLSENRDRVSRIRKGAYMVKSSPAGHSSRY